MELVPEKEKSSDPGLNERCYVPDQDICNAPSNSSQLVDQSVPFSESEDILKCFAVVNCRLEYEDQREKTKQEQSPPEYVVLHDSCCQF